MFIRQTWCSKIVRFAEAHNRTLIYEIHVQNVLNEYIHSCKIQWVCVYVCVCWGDQLCWSFSYLCNIMLLKVVCFRKLEQYCMFTIQVKSQKLFFFKVMILARHFFCTLYFVLVYLYLYIYCSLFSLSNFYLNTFTSAQIVFFIKLF